MRKKILLVQLFSNGDCLYATAVARQIKSDFPDCELTWAIAPFCKNIIAHNPYVDHVLVVDEVAKNDVAALRRYKRKVAREKAAGKWDEVFVTTNMDTNLAYYDGTIRGMILRAYGRPITVPLQPVLVLAAEEKQRVADFADFHRLSTFKNVILWEFAPQSGQADLSFDTVFQMASEFVKQPDTAVILSSGNPFPGNQNIIDASSLSVRENAALTHHCSLLIGCSSGITWLTTSSAAKFLPMVQLLNSDAPFINRPSEDFRRYNITHNGLIELDKPSAARILHCVTVILQQGFGEAQNFQDPFELKTHTSRRIFYNLMVYLEFASVRKHIDVMEGVYGRLPALRKALTQTIITLPGKLLRNRFAKLLKGK